MHRSSLAHLRLALVVSLVAVAISAGEVRSQVVVEQGRFHLFWVQQLAGTETYVIRSSPDSLTLTSDFEYVDRGTPVPLNTRLTLQRDLTPIRFAIRGRTARTQTINKTVNVGGTVAMIRDGLVTQTDRVAPPFFTIASYAPASVQMMMIRYWEANGRPESVRTLPDGDVRIEHRGQDVVSYAGQQIVLQRYAIEGVIWGSETVWTDARGKLIAAVTIDGEGEPFEVVRDGFESLLSFFVTRGVEDGMNRLAQMGRMGSFATTAAFALTGGTLIDGLGGPPIEDAVVVMRGDSIEAAGPAATTPIPAGVRTFDVTGKTIIPGLWDMHARFQQVELGPAYLAAGVTTVRDLGNGFEFVTAVRDALNRGEGVGPRMLLAGAIVGNEIDGRSDALTTVRRYKNASFDQVMIYSLVAPGLVPTIADEAHSLEMTVAGNVPDGMDAIAAINAGVDMISDAGYVLDAMVPIEIRVGDRYDRPIPDSDKVDHQYVLNVLVSNGTVLDPTLAATEFSNRPSTTPVESIEPGIVSVAPELARLLRAYGVPPSEGRRRQPYFDALLKLVGAAHRAGIPIVAGSDVTVPGHSLHRELELYVRAGLTPMEALQSATIIPARVMGQEEKSGSIVAGKWADMVVLDASPLDDISNVRRIDRVVSRGRFYAPDDLWRRVDFTPFAPEGGSDEAD